ncbi:probable carbohydrate esterase At4g34215 [Phalaenopsis equestris]|uniref:probable carbohydrate esterase At4g34215 n=1 Tax=Phalaenopsis equestris TaxID=78828 RepID=UPI0009E4B1FE|nr:probable carbohydrate esterase At4g34215 [Phalaenopsis equestris]
MLPLPTLLLLLLLSTSTTAHKNSIFLLAGQSNMSGRGGVIENRWDNFIPPECRPTPDILRLSSHLQWEQAVEPIHADIDVYATCGVGPGMPFAHALLAAEGTAAPVRLVPCAVGATPIREWERGTTLYANLVRRAQFAAAGGGRVAAVLWYQGETDTISMADAEVYGGRMEALVSDLREDLGDPDLLFIQVALATGQGKYIDMVRKAQKGIRLHNVLCVDAKGLPIGPDYVHLTTQAQVRLGQMLADAYLSHTAFSLTYYAAHKSDSLLENPSFPVAFPLTEDKFSSHRGTAAPVRLVPCAVGATPIREWERGTTLYANLVRRAQFAAAGGGRVAAVLWYQGETDTISMADAEVYGGRMEALVSDLREDLGDPDLLFIQVALATGQGKYIDMVRKAQKGIRLHNVLCVDAKGLPIGPDYVHLTTQAQVRLGQMLADAYLSHTAFSLT